MRKLLGKWPLKERGNGRMTLRWSLEKQVLNLGGGYKSLRIMSNSGH